MSVTTSSPTWQSVSMSLHRFPEITSHQLRRCAQLDFSDGGDSEELDHGALIADIVELIEKRVYDPNPNSVLLTCMRKLTRAKLKEYCRTPQRTPDYLKHEIDYLSSLFKFQLQTTQQLFASGTRTKVPGQWGCTRSCVCWRLSQSPRLRASAVSRR